MQARNRALYQNVRRMASSANKAQPGWWTEGTAAFFTKVGPLILRAAHNNGIKLSDAALAAMVRFQPWSNRLLLVVCLLYMTGMQLCS